MSCAFGVIGNIAMNLIYKNIFWQEILNFKSFLSLKIQQKSKMFRQNWISNFDHTWANGIHATLPSELINLSMKGGSLFVCQTEISQSMGHPTHPWYFQKNSTSRGAFTWFCNISPSNVKVIAYWTNFPLKMKLNKN